MSAANARSLTGPSSCAIAVSIRGAPTSAMVELAQLFDVLLHRLAQLPHAPHPQLGVAGPVGVVEGAPRGIDGAAHVVGVGVGGDAQHLLGGRVDRREGARAAGRQLAVDEQSRSRRRPTGPFRTPVCRGKSRCEPEQVVDTCPILSHRTIAVTAVGGARADLVDEPPGSDKRLITSIFSYRACFASPSSDSLDMCPAMHWLRSRPTAERPDRRRRRATAARRRPSARCSPPAWKSCARSRTPT